MQNQTAFFRIIGVAGQIGSGKTSLALALCKRINAQRVSFGDCVRSEALRRGITPDRSSLQMLGENLIAELGPYGFVRKVLNSIDKHPIVVLDGVRHIEIWQAVCLFTFQNTLIYLDIEESIRLNRLKNRDGLDDESIKNAMHHPMEENIPQLKSLADIVLSEGTIEEMVAEILSRLEEL